ncbi:uncharacterized protein LOC107759612 [Nicotiana tabacum]|uniref:uncharacterized protein LOC107759612 n=1 Tax=Nicotiana tabacum TaxID=4097 RepID=UPI003F4E6CA3
MVYAYNDMALRRNLWKEIMDIHNHTRGPWAVKGDFNSVLHKEDRVGSPVTVAEIRDSRQCYDLCYFQELKSAGAYYTWNNKQSGVDRVLRKIDRILANIGWLSQLPTSMVNYMTEGLFDHSPAMINWENENQRINRPFKYFNIWSMDPEFKNKVGDRWIIKIRGTKMYQLVGKLNRLKRVLKHLNINKFSDIELKVEQVKEELEECQKQIQQNPINYNLIDKDKELANKYSRLKKASDQFLRQKSKVKWLKQGDQNNRYFHMYMKA